MQASEQDGLSALLDAAADLVLADGQVQVAEAELLRALCTLLDSPMPPLFPSKG